MIATTLDPPTTYMPRISINAVIMEEAPRIDSFGGMTYLAFKSMFSESTSRGSSGFYFVAKEEISFANHIDLIGKEATRFDEIVESITEPNAFMSEILKDVYENRIFE